MGNCENCIADCSSKGHPMTITDCKRFVPMHIIHIRFCPHCGSKNPSKNLKPICCCACHIYFEHYPKLKAKADVCDELVKVCEMVLRSKALILPKGGFMKAENADEIRALLTMYDNVEQALAKAKRIKE